MNVLKLHKAEGNYSKQAVIFLSNSLGCASIKRRHLDVRGVWSEIKRWWCMAFSGFWAAPSLIGPLDRSTQALPTRLGLLTLPRLASALSMMMVESTTGTCRVHCLLWYIHSKSSPPLSRLIAAKTHLRS